MIRACSRWLNFCILFSFIRKFVSVAVHTDAHTYKRERDREFTLLSIQNIEKNYSVEGSQYNRVVGHSAVHTYTREVDENGMKRTTAKERKRERERLYL